jgi:hypothetical protein
MDPVYDQAVKRLETLESEAAELRKFIELYRRTRHLLGLERAVDDGDKSTLPSGENAIEKPEIGRRRKVTDNPKPAVVVAESLKILAERGAPMTRRELHEALAQRGFEVRGADPIKALGTMLWRAKDQIVQLEGHGYWIKAEPLPDVDYDPRHATEKEEWDRLIG